LAWERPTWPGRGRADCRGAVDSWAANLAGVWAGMEIRIGSFAGEAATVGCAAAWARNAFAAAVLSVPHAGHNTCEGMRLLTGSTSKANRCPHSHCSLMRVIGLR